MTDIQNENLQELSLQELNDRIPCPDIAAYRASLERWSQVAKPLKSLGVLEDLVSQIAGIRGQARFDLSRRALVVMCADNGVVAQGVTQTDESITSLVAKDLVLGCSSANLMAKVAGCEVLAVDVGIKNPPDAPGLFHCSVARGTKDFTQGPAMTKDEAMKALHAGVAMAQRCARQGFGAIATGEMGIGNTTTTAAVASVLLDCDPEEITGRGAGLSTEGLTRKIAAVKRGIELNRPDKGDALDVVAKVGGFDIAGMAGLFIGGALCRLPVVIDGVISAVSALAAVRMCPRCAPFMIPSHMSSEPAAQKVFDALGLSPVLNAGLHLGEGTGALCLFPLLDMALSLYNGLVFSDIGMNAYTPQV